MSLIISIGSNLGDRKKFLSQAKIELTQFLQLKAVSRIYQSPAQDYTSQPDFLNQLIEFEIPSNMTAQTVLEKCLVIEHKLGRIRNIAKGPRTIDIDIVFWNLEIIKENNLIIPHPEWLNRSFVVYPLMELPFFNLIRENFKIPDTFEISATVFE